MRSDWQCPSLTGGATRWFCLNPSISHSSVLVQLSQSKTQFQFQYDLVRQGKSQEGLATFRPSHQGGGRSDWAVGGGGAGGVTHVRNASALTDRGQTSRGPAAVQHMLCRRLPLLPPLLLLLPDVYVHM